MSKERYRLSDGSVVKGVTTIISDIIAKPALIHWAWRCGMENLDYRKVRDAAADIGTIAHYLIKCHLKKEKPDLKEYSTEAVAKAQTAFGAFLEFEKQHKLEPIIVEQMFVSEELRYGGTPDLYCKCDDKLTLIDFKTGNRIYPEFKLQIAAYKHLLTEQDHPVEQVHLLQVDKETGEFHHYQINDLTDAWEMFKLLLQIFPLKNRIWKK